MKILHWNIHGWTDADGLDNVDRVIDLVREVDPDVISFVEVDEEWGNPSKLRRVAETLGYCWAFVPAFEYREEGGFGNALVSKSAFSSVEQWQLLPPRLYLGTETSEPRALLLAGLRSNSRLLTVGSTHLPRLNRGEREIAMRVIQERLSIYQRRTIVCGDFNQPPAIWDGSRFRIAATGATYPGDDPIEEIDYFVLSPDIDAYSILKPRASASDHLPILLQVEAD